MGVVCLRERDRERESVYVCVCVCVCKCVFNRVFERERERERMCVCQSRTKCLLKAENNYFGLTSFDTEKTKESWFSSYDQFVTAVRSNRKTLLYFL